jgi:hypothetical protein
MDRGEKKEIDIASFLSMRSDYPFLTATKHVLRMKDEYSLFLLLFHAGHVPCCEWKIRDSRGCRNKLSVKYSSMTF